MTLADARTLSSGQILETDVCIVGAGAAGIALAKEFARASFRVLLLESGGLNFEHRTQWLYKGENTGRRYFSQEFTRRRQFGGTTVVWSGRCRPLDEMDFESRPWLPFSGWPFPKSHLDPFYARAQEIVQAGPYDYDCDPDPMKTAELETKVFRFSPPLDFGQAYRTDLERAANIHVLLHANVVHIALSHEKNNVSHLDCAALTRRPFRVVSKLFILAAGGLENTRLLLASRDVQPEGIGNQHDLVGRFFMDHPYMFSAAVTHIPESIPPDYLKLDYETRQSNLGVHKSIGFPQNYMRKERLLNACMYLVNRKSYKMDDRFYTKAAIDLAAFMEILQHKARPSVSVMAAAGKAMPHASWLIGKALSTKRTNSSRQGFALRLQIETAPNPESRVTLSEKKDILGVPRVNLKWKTTAQDIDSYMRFEQSAHTALQKTGFRLRRFKHELDSDGWPLSMTGGKHHMGTTRMHTNPRQGVVDEHCRVHGVNNLFIAGGSVFPTSGMANPTLTIIALAVRLADHIKQRLL